MGYFVASSMESVAALMKEKRTPLQESDKKQPWPTLHTLVFGRKRAETATARGLTKKDVAKIELCRLSFQPQGEDSRRDGGMHLETVIQR